MRASSSTNAPTAKRCCAQSRVIAACSVPMAPLGVRLFNRVIAANKNSPLPPRAGLPATRAKGAGGYVRKRYGPTRTVSPGEFVRRAVCPARRLDAAGLAVTTLTASRCVVIRCARIGVISQTAKVEPCRLLLRSSAWTKASEVLTRLSRQSSPGT